MESLLGICMVLLPWCLGWILYEYTLADDNLAHRCELRVRERLRSQQRRYHAQQHSTLAFSGKKKTRLELASFLEWLAKCVIKTTRLLLRPAMIIVPIFEAAVCILFLLMSYAKEVPFRKSIALNAVVEFSEFWGIFHTWFCMGLAVMHALLAGILLRVAGRILCYKRHQPETTGSSPATILDSREEEHPIHRAFVQWFCHPKNYIWIWVVFLVHESFPTLYLYYFLMVLDRSHYAFFSQMCFVAMFWSYYAIMIWWCVAKNDILDRVCGILAVQHAYRKYQIALSPRIHYCTSFEILRMQTIAGLTIFSSPYIGTKLLGEYDVIVYSLMVANVSFFLLGRISREQPSFGWINAARSNNVRAAAYGGMVLNAGFWACCGGLLLVYSRYLTLHKITRDVPSWPSLYMDILIGAMCGCMIFTVPYSWMVQIEALSRSLLSTSSVYKINSDVELLRSLAASSDLSQVKMQTDIFVILIKKAKTLLKIASGNGCSIDSEFVNLYALANTLLLLSKVCMKHTATDGDSSPSTEKCRSALLAGLIDNDMDGFHHLFEDGVQACMRYFILRSRRPRKADATTNDNTVRNMKYSWSAGMGKNHPFRLLWLEETPDLCCNEMFVKIVRAVGFFTIADRDRQRPAKGTRKKHRNKSKRNNGGMTVVNMFMQIGGIHNLLHFLHLPYRYDGMSRKTINNGINIVSMSQIEEAILFVLEKLCTSSQEIEHIWLQNGGCGDIINRMHEYSGIDSILKKNNRVQKNLLLLTINVISSLRLQVFKSSLLDQGLMANLVSLAKTMHSNRAAQVAALRAIASLCKPSARMYHDSSRKVPQPMLAADRVTLKTHTDSVAQRAQREFHAASGIDVLLKLINISLAHDVRSHRGAVMNTNPLDMFLACLMVVSIALTPSDARVVVSKCGGFAFLTEAVTAAIRRNIGKASLDTAIEDVYRWLRVVGSRRKIYAGEDAMVSNAQLITFLSINS